VVTNRKVYIGKRGVYFMREKLVTSDIHELLAKYNDISDRSDVAIGLRPSGVIHLGNMATLTLAGIVAREIGAHMSQVNTTVCDLDLPDSSDWNIKEKGCVKYFKDLPDRQGCHRDLLSHALDRIQSFTTGLEHVLGVKYDVQLLSQVQRQEGFREGLLRVLRVPGLTKYLNHHFKGKGQVLVFPVCPECGTSSPYPSEYRDERLFTKCSNEECSMGEYDVEVRNCDRDLAVHYFIDPLRDRMADPKSDIHVFGGDYADGSGDCCGNDTPKVKKILKVMNIAGNGDVPDILIGPTFYSRDGSKMSKSKDNGLSLDRLRHHFGVSYVSHIAGFMEFLFQEKYRNVDYQIVERELLSQ